MSSGVGASLIEYQVRAGWRLTYLARWRGDSGSVSLTGGSSELLGRLLRASLARAFSSSDLTESNFLLDLGVRGPARRGLLSPSSSSTGLDTSNISYEERRFRLVSSGPSSVFSTLFSSRSLALSLSEQV